MSEQAFEWKLTPTERRVAEHAFAACSKQDTLSRLGEACIAVWCLRSTEFDARYSVAEAALMLEELQREPSWSLDSQAMDSLLLSGYRARKLLERALEKSIDDEWLAEAREVLKP